MLERVFRKHVFTKAVFKAVLYIMLVDITFVFIYPFIYMLVTSVKSVKDLNDITVIWIPSALEMKNYIVAVNTLSYLNYIKNSVIVTVLATFGHVAACSFTGYGFARFKFPGRNVLFTMVVFTMLIPVHVLIIPLYKQFSILGWINTYLPLIVPTFLGFGLRGGLFVFIFRQFYLGLPNELEKAAKIDGCGFLRTFISIILPISKSSILVTVILSVVWHWNEYFESNIYINNPLKLMLPAKLPYIYDFAKISSVELFALKQRMGEIEINIATAMAATFMVILPIFILYLILQKQFMEGIERTGIVE